MRLSEQREALTISSRAISHLHPEMTIHLNLHLQQMKIHFLKSSRGMQKGPDPEEEPVWLVGNQCSIADLSFLTWANVVDRIGIDLETEFPVAPNL